MKLTLPPLLILLTVFGLEAHSEDDAAKALFAGRGPMERRALVEAGGGNDASEKAVSEALKWLANHQLPDGGWNFDHRNGGDCKGKCNHPGTADGARNAATAMALLAYLGAGHTHQDGEYKKRVGAGLDYLVANLKPQAGGGSFHEPQGHMYSHGLATIALCEAYGMTKDKRLLGPAQAAVLFIVFAQDPVGGGWRYNPKQAGDTSVLGWQLAALKSAEAAGLHVPAKTIKGAEKFLNAVDVGDGSTYGYTIKGRGIATSAIGLLGRMYLGWEKDHPGLVKGVKRISEQGPSAGDGRGNLYYNYYANQVMFHHGGKEWKKWNKQLRNWLVEQQDQEGHTAGSWRMTGSSGAGRGGRLYCTTMAVLMLETYYRHTRLYNDKPEADAE